jgi:hypothetical protein
MSPDDIWSLIADGLGVVSGLLLGWSALRVNGLLKEASELRDMLVSTQSGLEKQAFEKMKKRAQEMAGSWDKWDERRLYGGIVILILSFAAKLVSSLLKVQVL